MTLTLVTNAYTNGVWLNFLVWSPLWLHASSFKNKTAPSAALDPTALCCLFPAAVARVKNERRRRTFAVFQGRHYLPYYYIFWNLFIAIAEYKKPITKHQMSANIDITTIWKKRDSLVTIVIITKNLIDICWKVFVFSHQLMQRKEQKFRKVAN